MQETEALILDGLSILLSEAMKEGQYAYEDINSFSSFFILRF